MKSDSISNSTGIRISELEVPREDVADFLRSASEGERDNTPARAIEVGVFCLERASSAEDLEFVRRQVELLIDKFTLIGAGEEQVLASIASVVDSLANSHAGPQIAGCEAQTMGLNFWSNVTL